MNKLILCALTLLSLSLTRPALAGDEQGFTDSFATLNTNRWYVSNGWTNGPHQSCEWRADAWSVNGHGLTMTLSDKGGKVLPIGCPEMHSNAKLGYGRYETRMKPAAGSGLNSAFFSYIGPPNGVAEWDEIDFEFLGKDPTKVELNYYVNGKLTKGTYYSLGFDSSEEFHDYAFDWAPTSITWYVDGKVAYQTPAGAAIPRNPSFMFFSLWSGSSVEDSWMGKFSYTSPAIAEVASAKFTPRAAQ